MSTPKNFTTLVDGQPVHVNRRGCKGPWTAKDQQALEAITRAVRKMEAEKPSRAPASLKPEPADASR